MVVYPYLFHWSLYWNLNTFHCFYSYPHHYTATWKSLVIWKFPYHISVNSILTFLPMFSPWWLIRHSIVWHSLFFLSYTLSSPPPSLYSRTCLQVFSHVSPGVFFVCSPLLHWQLLLSLKQTPLSKGKMMNACFTELPPPKCQLFRKITYVYIIVPYDSAWEHRKLK